MKNSLLSKLYPAIIAGLMTLPINTLHAETENLDLSLLLNTSFSGPVSFFMLAQDRGYFEEEGLTIKLSPGGGAAVVVPQMQHGRFDAGYGDMSALIERIANGPMNEGPVAVYTTFNAVPFTIAVASDGSIQAPEDLEGKVISGHPRDAALITFDMFAEATGLDASTVQVSKRPTSMGSQVVNMLEGRGADGVFGFVNTIVASVASYGINASEQIRFLEYADYLPDMYGNTLFVTRELYQSNPDAIGGLVQALNQGLRDTVANPNDAIEALEREVGTHRSDVNLKRLIGTLEIEIAHPEGARIGVGNMDDARLQRLINQIVKTKNLPRTPSVAEVFDRSFLPDESELIKSLAKK